MKIGALRCCLRVFLLAVLGSTLVLAGALSAVIALWQPRSLEAMIPGNSTVAFFSNATREDVREWGDQIAVLRTVPDFAGQLDVGVLRLDGGTQGWILTSRSKKIALPDTNGDFRGQTVLVSDPRAMGMMTGNAERLRSSTPFRQLTDDVPENATSVYLTTRGNEAMAVLPDMLRPFIHASGGLLVSKDAEMIRLRVFGKPVEMDDSLVPSITAVRPQPDLTITLPAPARMFEQELSELPEAQRAIRRGQLAKQMDGILGGEWSLQYDILPLLQEQTTFHVTFGTGAVPSFLVHGSGADPAELR